MGYIWHNRSESVKSSGIGEKTILQKHSNFLSNFDKYRIKLLCKNESIYFGYEKISTFNNIILFILPLLLIFPFKCDVIFRREFFRFKAMLKLFSNDKQPIYEWILFNSVVNTLAGAELIKIKKVNNNKYVAIFSLLVVIPIYLLRIIKNYLKVRMLTINIWFKLVTKKSGKIKILSC